jgi:hypothetical protein
MTTTVRAVFDGRVFRPEVPVALEPNARYVLTVEREDAEEVEGYPLSALEALATDMGVADLAARHAWYARRRPEDVEGAAGEPAASNAPEQ